VIYLCLIAMAVLCVAAGWQLRGNYDDRHAPRFPIDDAPPLPAARIHRDPLDTPAATRRQRDQRDAVFVHGKRQRIAREVIDIPVAD